MKNKKNYIKKLYIFYPSGNSIEKTKHQWKLKKKIIKIIKYFL